MKAKIAVLSMILVLFGVLAMPLTSVADTADVFAYVLDGNAATVTAYHGADSHVVVPDTLGGARVTAIGNNVFASSAVVSVTLPETVRTIGEGAFQNAAQLQTVTLGGELETVGYSAFSGCVSLASVHFGGTVTAWDRVVIHACNDELSAASMTFGAAGFATQSLLPTSASAFTKIAVNNQSVRISGSSTSGYTFRSSAYWPYAYVDYGVENGIAVDVAAEQYLNYDFEVTSGRTNVAVYFNSPNPLEPEQGTFLCLNGHVDPRNIDAAGVVTDLRPGRYKGSIKISDLGCRADQMTDGRFVITGFRVFSVTNDWDGTGDVTVYELSVGDSAAEAALPKAARDGERISLLPTSANGFVKDYSQGPIYVTKERAGYRFESYYSWPYAYTKKAPSAYVDVDVTADHYLYYDFTVTSALTNICVYFGGTAPMASDTYGTFISLNELVDASNVNGGIVTDIGTGSYRGCVRIGDLGLHPSVLSGNRTTVGDVLVFAVSTGYETADVLVKEIAVIKGTSTTSSSTVTTTTTTTKPPVQEIVTYSVGDVVGKVGDIVETPITVSDGHYMVNGQLVVRYDPAVLALRTVTDDPESPYAAALNTALFRDEPFWALYESAPGEVHLAFASGASSGAATGGTLLTLAFEIVSETPGGTTVSLAVPEMYSVAESDGKRVGYDTETSLTAGTVTVFGDFLKGDVNDDGKVDIADAVMVFRGANGRIILTPEQAYRGELNDDGKTDIADAVMLFRYANGRISVL